MENQTKVNIGFGAVIALIASFVLIGNIEPTHYCESREIKMYCSTLTKYYGLENGKCINPSGNKLCRSGWEEIPKIEEIKKVEEFLPQSSSGNIHCTNKGCLATIYIF